MTNFDPHAEGLVPVTGNAAPVAQQLAAMGGKFHPTMKVWCVPADRVSEAYALVDAHTKPAPRTRRNKAFNREEGWTG